MKEDINYCSSSFLMFRSIIDENMSFNKNIKVKHYELPNNRTKIHNSEELYDS